jgi:outer membrane protein assembly factor BamB
MPFAALLFALNASDPLLGSDSWPGWRGADGSGVAGGSPPIEWSEEEHVRWKVALPGKGNSQPIVWGDRVFVTTAVGTGKKIDLPAAGGEREGGPPRDGGARRGPPRTEDGDDRPPRGDGPPRGDAPPQDGERGPGRRGPARALQLEEQDFVVLALDRASGAEVWRKKLATAMPHQGTHRDGSYASPTPVTDGMTLFVSFGSFGVYALSLTGELLWQVDLGDMQIQNAFGEGSSPVVWKELLILNWDHEGDSFLVALEKGTGKERWRTPRPRGTSWTTPLVVRTGEREVIVVGGGRATAYEPATGRELWHHGETGSVNVIASPVAIDELVVCAHSSRGGGEARGLVVEPRAAKGEPAEALWSLRVDAPHVPSPLAYEGKVYMLKQDSGMLSVLDPSSGKVVYGPERLEGVALVFASLVAANGHLYVAGRDGTVEVLTTWPDIRTVAVNELEEGFDASPAIAGDELFLRGRESLYCIAAK